ncbi:hypothetical protein C8J56DRAFT_904077 [Mycena floridula]|nr:hypothetical protein C8J56DRAFT_904077 [Mycena floridula]
MTQTTSFGGKIQIRQLMADGITINAATLTAPSKLGTDGGIVAPTEMRFVPPAKEAKGYPKEAENKRGGAIIHIGKMIRTSLPPAISGKTTKPTVFKLLAALAATTKERDPKPTQNQRQRRSMTHQEHDRAVDRGCKKPFLQREKPVFQIKVDQIIQNIHGILDLAV